MSHSVRTITIPINSLGVDAGSIRRAGRIPREMPSVSEMLDEAAGVVSVRAGWRRFACTEIHVASGRVVLDGVEFRPGRIITPQLATATAAALLVATLGPEFDEWSRSFFERDDPYLGFLADTIGSELAEATADAAQSALESELLDEGLGATRRFSPGYCSWDVAEQRLLFSRLPDQFCGITLGAGSFMSPVKSVSALIGVGPEATKTPYPCRHCDAEDCAHRKGES